MGYYEKVGMDAAERAEKRIANGENPSTVHKQELGGALGQAVVGGIITAAAPVIITAAGVKFLWDKARGKSR